MAAMAAIAVATAAATAVAMVVAIAVATAVAMVAMAVAAVVVGAVVVVTSRLLSSRLRPRLRFPRSNVEQHGPLGRTIAAGHECSPCSTGPPVATTRDRTASPVRSFFLRDALSRCGRSWTLLDLPLTRTLGASMAHGV